eukprot:TRINITY_DN47119_c0_g1_i1.p1 TRINITY_DN47119_c0_g1~~TRINITY_DN47119_c0_g1_i1.p1  ORF type:complete len:1184 (-),score=149.59 TRINITY_DN47119_c0_g1_i1:46-3597(-)
MLKWQATVLLLALTSYAGSCERCLQDAAREVKRIAVRNVSLPLGIWNFAWNGSLLAGNIMAIIAKELLGLETVLNNEQLGQSSVTGIRMLAGCRDPFVECIDDRSEDADAFRYHLAFETWAAVDSLQAEWRRHLPSRAPIKLSDLGYTGTEGVRVKAGTIVAAVNTGGISLDYYRAYNASWHQPVRFFSSLAEIEDPDMPSCLEMKKSVDSYITDYIKWFADDNDGYYRDGDGGFNLKCFRDKWWLSPACRSNPSSCVPVLLGSHAWGLSESMQKSNYYNMPWAVGFVKDDAALTAKKMQFSLLYFGFSPDGGSNDHSELLVFPAHIASLHKQNLYTTASQSIQLYKWAITDLGKISPRAYAVASRMRMEGNDMMRMLAQLEAGLPAGDVACRFLSETSYWKAWVPGPTECQPGEGLVNEHGDLILGARHESKSAVGCATCTAGRYSESKNGSDHNILCNLCDPGRFQNEDGELTCGACEIGRYSGSPGSTGCTSCPLGRFAGSSGADSCVACPEDFTTSGERSTSLSDCLCKQGNYMVTVGSDWKCRSCSWGHTTPSLGASSPQECELDWQFVTFNTAIVLALMLVCTPPLAALCCHYRYLRVRKHDAMREVLKQGFSSICCLQHPMCLMSLSDFDAMTEAEVQECHEGARDAGLLLFLDSMDELETFQKTGKKILFLSYHWLSWTKLGPNTLQLTCMQGAAKEVCNVNDVPEEDMYIWLDVLSIPQNNSKCKALAVDSLHTYSSRADFLVAICPKCFHDDTGELTGPDSYKSRIWCRVEQVAHSCSNGFAGVYYTTRPGELTKIDEDWIHDVVYIFEGQVTCCRLGHPGGRPCDRQLLVPPLLAMYAQLSAQVSVGYASEHKLNVWRQINADKHRVFPRNFSYHQDDGRVSEKRLFGSLIDYIHDLVHTDSGSEQILGLSRSVSQGGADGVLTVSLPTAAPSLKRTPTSAIRYRKTGFPTEILAEIEREMSGTGSITITGSGTLTKTNTITSKLSMNTTAIRQRRTSRLVGHSSTTQSRIQSTLQFATTSTTAQHTQSGQHHLLVQAASSAAASATAGLPPEPSALLALPPQAGDAAAGITYTPSFANVPSKPGAGILRSSLASQGSLGPVSEGAEGMESGSVADFRAGRNSPDKEEDGADCDLWHSEEDDNVIIQVPSEDRPTSTHTWNRHNGKMHCVDL